MPRVICTFAEKRHFIGLAALINSLVQAGFEGTLCVGHRGEVPRWLHNQIQHHRSSISKVRVEFETVTQPGHMTNLKPDWMLQVWSRFTDAERLVYIDPDVCVLCPWQLIEDWIGQGVALAQDMQPPLTQGHWLLKSWQHAFSSTGLELRQTPSEYINAGFIGVHRDAVSLLHRWRDMLRIASGKFGGLEASNLGGGKKTSQITSPYAAFSQTDQDVLNAALRCGDEPLSLVGPEGMGFMPGVAIMSHAVGVKPWDKRFLRLALRGIRPTFADRMFLRFSSGPVRAMRRPSSIALAFRIAFARMLSTRITVPQR